MVTLIQMIEREKAARSQLTAQLATLRDDAAAAKAAAAKERRALSEDEAYTRLTARAVQVGEQIEQLNRRIDEWEAEQREDDRVTALSNTSIPTGAPSPDAEARVLGTGGHAVTTERTGVEAGSWVRRSDGRPAALDKGQRWAEHEIVREHATRNSAREAAVIGQHGSLGQMVRSMTTTSGSALVPTVWASDVIDRARNHAAVLQAGANVVPMDAKIVQIGRLTADPTASFRAEGTTITASDPTFDNVTLTATTMSALVVGSLEWFQDAENVDAIVTDAIAKAIGLNLDLAALYGSITSGAGAINLPTPPNPRGILGALNANAPTSVLPSSGPAANGTTQTASSFWNEILDLVYTPADYNEKPNAVIWNSKAARKYAKAYDTTGQPLRRPDDLSGLSFYVSNQIPSYTQGTMTGTATDVFAGDFSQLLIGQRMELQIQTLTERYAELGQVGIVANWRGDIGIARNRAFSVFKAIQGA